MIMFGIIKYLVLSKLKTSGLAGRPSNYTFRFNLLTIFIKINVRPVPKKRPRMGVGPQKHLDIIDKTYKISAK